MSRQTRFVANGKVARRQCVRNGGVVEPFADPLTDEVGSELVGDGVDEQVGERERDAVERSPLPAGAEPPFPLAGIGRRGEFLADRVEHTDVAAPYPLAVLGIVGLARRRNVRVDRCVARRDRECGGALEHGEVLGLLGDQRDRLDARRAGTDDGDPLAGEVDAVVRPQCRVQRRPAEGVDARQLGTFRRREATGRHQHEPRRGPVTTVRGHLPAAGDVVPHGVGDSCVELDVAAQIEPVGDVVGIAEDLRLGGVALAPVPLLLQLRGERVRVVERLDVAACPGVAVPPPRPAHAAGGLEAAHGQTEPAQPVDGVHPGEPRPDDHDVEAIHHHPRILAPLHPSVSC